VSADGAEVHGGYPPTPALNGGMTIRALDSREEAVTWAACIPHACQCAQELRVFGFDRDS
jgi:hypothetical protein